MPAVEGYMVALRRGVGRERPWCFEGCPDDLYETDIDITCQGYRMLT